MRNGTKRAYLAGVAALLIASPLLASPADQVATRVAGLRELGAAFKTVNDSLKSDTPQTMLIQISARQIRAASQAQYGWFPAGSGPQPGVKTSAKAEIWTQPVQFKAEQDNFATQANAFFKVAAGGNVDAIRAQAKLLGQACGACHRQFRVDDH